MVFVTRFAEAFKGYICIYFANLEREIAESFDGFWKVTVDHHVYIMDFYISQILLVDIILPYSYSESCYCKAICKQNFQENCLNFDFPKKRHYTNYQESTLPFSVKKNIV